jgi:hypothetical protein
MQDPRAYREAGVTYFVPPFTEGENLYVNCYKLVPITYQWKNKPTGRMGTHIVFLFPEDVKRFPSLLQQWNRTQEWEYSKI